MNALGQLGSIRRPGSIQVPQRSADAPKVSFAEVLQGTLEDNSQVKFSAHAVKRLEMRNISLSEDQLTRLNSAVGQAEEKGSKDSLIMMNDLAFVVSVKNRTVITAMDGQSVKDNVFTNIDSAVIV